MGNGKSKLNSSLNYLDNIIEYINYLLNKNNYDIDNYYYDLLSLAIEYGMTPKQFWEEDIELFYCYQNAYLNRIHTQCHTQGLYNSIALGVVLGNMLKKKGTKDIEYPKENLLQQNLSNIKQNIQNGNSNKKQITKCITKSNLEEQYRLRLSKCY